jgi:hypothetical protein
MHRAFDVGRESQVEILVVLRKTMTVDAEALRGFVRERLGGFKVPKQIR